ncbi:hypothetical protein VTN31DRAFT_1914 [Thermomyces dupontii]|uniref:uncharacterized protein n=1 Tax=Talaromyces thermophilus TaxID=28565 RepID=UPI003743F05A
MRLSCGSGSRSGSWIWISFLSHSDCTVACLNLQKKDRFKLYLSNPYALFFPAPLSTTVQLFLIPTIPRNLRPHGEFYQLDNCTIDTASSCQQDNGSGNRPDFYESVVTTCLIRSSVTSPTDLGSIHSHQKKNSRLPHLRACPESKQAVTYFTASM